jgi:hypothetical protein
MSEAWEDEGFGGEDDWAEESAASDLEQEPLELDGLDDVVDSDNDELQDEQ